MRVIQKALQLPLHSSFLFFLSLQQIWTWLTKVACPIFRSVILDECHLIWTHWRNVYVKHIYCNLKFRVWKHDIPYTLEKIIMAEVSKHIIKHVNVINVLHDVNSILYTVTNIHPKAEIFLKLSMLYAGKTQPYSGEPAFPESEIV